LAGASSAFADVEFYQSVDRDQVGVEDSFHLTIVASGAPEDAQIQFPSSNDFEVLSRSQSTQMSYQLGGAGASFNRTQKFVLVMRAKKVGTLILPSAVMSASGKTYRTESLKITVRPGRIQDPIAGRPRRGAPLPDPFRGFPFPDDLLDSDHFDEEESQTLRSPRSEADVFLRAALDRPEVYAGEQLTLSLHILARVDVSGVDSVTLPKLDGFWSEEIESPTQLSGEQKMINGVPYRAFLLKRLALFPVKPGTLKIGSAEADITTGFIFTGRRVHRASNELTVRVKPLPPGAPPGFSSASVGKWTLAAEISQDKVELGQPVTLKLSLEGSGNVKNLALPSLHAPPGIRIYDPTTTDKLTPSHGKIGGKRTQEYLVMPQQTGTFTFSGMSFPYFDPETERYEEAPAEPLALTVVTGSGGVISLAGDRSTPQIQAKNLLPAGGLHPLRYRAHFSEEEEPIWRANFFLPGLLAPPGVWLAVVLFGFIRARFNQQDEQSVKRRRAKAAHRRLAAAEALKMTGNPQAFYAEVEKALRDFLEVKLGVPVTGLTRDLLKERLARAGLAGDEQLRVLQILDACDLGRFAPGGDGGQRNWVLDQAQQVIEGWNTPT
jgi:hypothetical protein